MHVHMVVYVIQGRDPVTLMVVVAVITMMGWMVRLLF